MYGWFKCRPLQHGDDESVRCATHSCRIAGFQDCRIAEMLEYCTTATTFIRPIARPFSAGKRAAQAGRVQLAFGRRGLKSTYLAASSPHGIRGLTMLAFPHGWVWSTAKPQAFAAPAVEQAPVPARWRAKEEKEGTACEQRRSLCASVATGDDADLRIRYYVRSLLLSCFGPGHAKRARQRGH